MTVTLTGPVVLPGDEDPVVGAPVRVKLIAGSPRDLGHLDGKAVLGTWQTETDDTGNFSVTVPPIDSSAYPTGAFYEVTVGGGRFPTYVRKVQPNISGTYVFTDPTIGGTDLLPPEFAQIEPSSQLAAQAVEDYFVAHPISVEDEVADALTAHPPLFVDNALSELTATQNTARGNIGAASDSEMDAGFVADRNRIGALELNESSDPAIRESDYDGNGLVMSDQYAVVVVHIEDDGSISFTTGDAVTGGALTTQFQPLDSDLTAIAAGGTTSYGRGILLLSDLAALQALLASSGTPSSTTYLRGDGTWATPAGGGGGGDVASDTIWDAKGDLAVGSAADTAAKLTVGANDTILMAASGQSSGLKWATPSVARTAFGLVPGTDVQAFDTDLAAIAALVSTADKIPYATGAGAWSLADFTAAGRALVDDADASAQRTTLGLVIGTDVQAYHANLAQLAGLSLVADRLPYANGTGTLSVATFTSFGRSVTALADAASLRTLAGLGSLATASTITSSDITDGTIVNADINASAAVAYSKLNLTGAILNADLAGSIAYGKLSLTGSILNADLAGSIAYGKLTLTGSIVNADVSASAAIAYSKLNLTGAVTNADLAGSIAYSKLSLTGAVLNADLAGSIAVSKLSITGTPDGTKFLRDDNTWSVPAGGGSFDLAQSIAFGG